MTEIQETKDSTGYQVNFTGDALQLTRVFDVVFRQSDADSGRARDDVAISLITQRIGPLGHPHPFMPTAFAETFNCRRVDGTTRVFKVTITYKGNQFDGPPDDPATGQTFSLSSTVVAKDVYRVGGTVPKGGNPSSGAADIGGTAIDILGTPTSIAVVRSTVTVNMTGTVDLGAPGNYIAGIQGLIGTRNNGTFLGAAPGNLLYKGASVNKISGSGAQTLVSVQHTFDYDDEAHLVQVAESTDLRPSGVQLGKDVGVSAYKLNAFKVAFVQPFPSTSNFSKLGINISG
tara:strand:- start:5574 stop:6437 length:864 start_codon:yes stop_codon:yes gene_type:complete